MDKFHFLHPARRKAILAALVLLSLGVLSAWLFSPQSAGKDAGEAALLDGFRHVEVASVSDALEQVAGKRMYMSHHMQSIFPTKFAGFAVTVLLKKAEANNDPTALNGMLAAIDGGSANSVYVMVVEDGADIAGMGGLMGTAMYSRGYAGAVIDGGVRDVAYLRKIGFPVYALGMVPSTSVNHYRFAGANIPVTCDGVPVQAARQCRASAGPRAGDGLQRTLDVCLHRETEIHSRGSEEVRAFVVVLQSGCTKRTFIR